MNSYDAVKLKDTIVSALRKEDNDLYENYQKGIFFLPELALTYLIGKALLRNSETIFGSRVSDWLPERKVMDGCGPTDLVLNLENNKTILFEFKCRCNDVKYIKDIEKLAQISSDNTLKFFCALMDRFAGEELNYNETICAVEERFNEQIKRVTEANKSFDYFTTKDHAPQYSKKQMSCVVGLWQVL